MNTDPEFEDADFVRISYTARVAETGRIIDTTDPDVAETAAIADLTATGPVVIVVGAGQLFDPVDEALRETALGETTDVTVPPEAGFGQSTPDGRRVVDSAELSDVDLDALEPGDRIHHDGEEPFVESVTDEQVTLNFDHPLAGMEIEYELVPVERVTGTRERAEGLLASYGLDEVVDVESDNDTLRLSVTPTETEVWADWRADLIADARNTLSVDRVQVIETYPATDDEGVSAGDGP